MKLIPTLRSALLGLAVFSQFPLLSPLQAEPPPGYHLVFHDEFSLPQLDPAKWITTMGFPGAAGGRYHNISYLNYNLDENILLEDGMLRLRTDKQTVVGIDPPGEFQYTGGLISSDGQFSFTYGYIEMRAKYPGGRGIWPVFWLMPQEAAWPPEFDIAEYYAGSKVMHHGLCHGDVYNPLWDSTGDTQSDAEGAYHTYALEWSPGRAVWYEDGIVKKTVEADYVPSAAMYVILNNGVSSHIGPSGQPNEHTVFPNYFEIDYVRVYQMDEASAADKALTKAAPSVPQPKSAAGPSILGTLSLTAP